MESWSIETQESDPVAWLNPWSTIDLLEMWVNLIGEVQRIKNPKNRYMASWIRIASASKVFTTNSRIKTNWYPYRRFAGCTTTLQQPFKLQNWTSIQAILTRCRETLWGGLVANSPISWRKARMRQTSPLIKDRGCPWKSKCIVWITMNQSINYLQTSRWIQAG